MEQIIAHAMDMLHALQLYARLRGVLVFFFFFDAGVLAIEYEI